MPSLPSTRTRPAVPSLFGTRDQFRGRKFFHKSGWCGWWWWWWFRMILIRSMPPTWSLALTVHSRLAPVWESNATAAEMVILISRIMEVKWSFKWWGAPVNTDEASLTHQPLTSCCEAQFLTGHGPEPVLHWAVAQALGSPAYTSLPNTSPCVLWVPPGSTYSHVFFLTEFKANLT